MLVYNSHSARRGRLLFAACVAALVLLAGARSLYAQSSIELEWDAPPGCPQRGDVLAKVRDIAGAAYEHRLGFRANGKVRLVNGRYQLALSVDGGGRVKERFFDSRSCANLSGAAAVVLGLELKRADEQPEGPSTTPEEEPPPPAPVGTIPDEEPVQTQLPEKAAPLEQPPPVRVEPTTQTFREPAPEAPSLRSQNSDSGVLLAPHVGVEVGLFPKANPTWGVALGGRVAPWSFWVAARSDGVQRVPADFVPDVGARIFVTSARLAISHGWRWNTLELSLGVTGGVGRLVAYGSGRDIVGSRATDIWGFVGPLVGARSFLTDWLALSATAAAEYSVGRPQVNVQHLGEVHRFGLGQIWVVVGPEWIF